MTLGFWRGFYFFGWGMDDNKDSLIQHAKRQMDLIPSHAMPDDIFAREEEYLVGEFTGERLFAQRPETYQWIVSLLAEHVGVIRIGKLLKVSPNTVRAVQQREGIAIDIEKKRIAELCHQGAALAFEGVIEDLSDPVKRGKIPTRDKAVAGAVMVDKGQLLAGEATSRLELHEIKTPDHDDFNAYIAGLPNLTRLGGENAGQKEGAAVASEGGGMPVADSKSDGSNKENQ